MICVRFYLRKSRTKHNLCYESEAAALSDDFSYTMLYRQDALHNISFLFLARCIILATINRASITGKLCR